MKLRIPAVLCYCACLACCNRPAEKNEDQHGASGSTKSAPRDRIVERDEDGDASASFRVMLENAMKTEVPLLREKALSRIAWEAMDVEPDAAHEAFRQLSDGSPEKLRLIQHYAMRLAEQDADEAIEWAATLENESEQAAAMGHVALEIAESDPLRAANLLSESGIAGREFDVVLVQVIQRWAGQSAPDAAAWVATFPPGDARRAGIKAIMERWLPKDPPGALGWLDKMEKGDLRDQAALVMQGVILQQPANIREDWLRHADAGIWDELERHSEQAIKDVGNNIPTDGK